ncbi:MAG: catechol 1,2-dioxygenase [Bacteroidota bacterium]
MKRRKFTALGTLSAIAFSTTGFVSFDGESYVGDCKTTTDILGPFYRPDSPMRDNLVIDGMPGELVELVGSVLHKDCTTPHKEAKVELWHCSADEVYDNDTDEFRYRGTTMVNEKGEYRFLTQMPVPYDAGGGNYRPAHFHLMISAPGYQSLVTQLYFTGDPWIDKDVSSTSPSAKGRILEVKDGKEGKKIVYYDIVMADKPLLEANSIDQLVGTYSFGKGRRKMTFSRKNGRLWMRNEIYGYNLTYIGKNTFHLSGFGDDGTTFKFKIQKDGKIKLTTSSVRGTNVAWKEV